MRTHYCKMWNFLPSTCFAQRGLAFDLLSRLCKIAIHLMLLTLRTASRVHICV